MNIGDLKNLKDISWYTTIPLFVCAWIMQDINLIQTELSSSIGFVKIVAEYFSKVVFLLVIAFTVWLSTAVRLEKDSFPFTLLLATFILTLAGVGFGVYIIKPADLMLPVNIVWFAAFASVAFNLYQIQENAHNKQINKD